VVDGHARPFSGQWSRSAGQSPDVPVVYSLVEAVESVGVPENRVLSEGFG
jgi:hypothetical protein